MLIAYEGIDGSGKSRSRTALQAALRDRGLTATVVEWTSFQSTGSEESALFRKAARLRRNGRLGPLAFSAWHCADFAMRLEQKALPAIARGEVVIMDRYVYTAFVRDTIRGLDEKVVRGMYGFAPDPDLILYLDIDPAIAYHRKKADNIRLGFYESGRDLFESLDEEAGFIAFQGLCRRRYQTVLPGNITLRLDGSRAPESLDAEILRVVESRLSV
jgi:dTMP kinase